MVKPKSTTDSAHTYSTHTYMHVTTVHARIGGKKKPNLNQQSKLIQIRPDPVLYSTTRSTCCLSFEPCEEPEDPLFDQHC